jgi:hypothetical protein
VLAALRDGGLTIAFVPLIALVDESGATLAPGLAAFQPRM